MIVVIGRKTCNLRSRCVNRRIRARAVLRASVAFHSLADVEGAVLAAVSDVDSDHSHLVLIAAKAPPSRSQS
jgi:hypothetical protein